MTERLHCHFSLSCVGEGNGNPLQYSCLEDPRDRGAWWAAVYGVAQSRTRLKLLSSSSSSRKKYMGSLKGKYRNAHISFLQNSPSLKITQASITGQWIHYGNWLYGTLWYILWASQVAPVVKNLYSYGGILQNNGKESQAIDEAHIYNVQWKN